MNVDDQETIESYEDLRNLLFLMGIDISVKQVKLLTEKQRDDAENWAAMVFLREIDYNVTVPPCPDFFNRIS